MLIDTHCHMQNMVKEAFDQPLTATELHAISSIIDQAADAGVDIYINVGTSYIESLNCIQIAKTYKSCVASIGIHPNDLTATWLKDFKMLEALAQNKEDHKIVAIGECGIDKHYPDYDMKRQKDAFRAHIELALSAELPLIIHTRQAPDETLEVLEQYKQEKLSGVVHCFSEDMAFAQHVIDLGFVLGIGGTITYPKNEALRAICKTVALEHIILETDAPFLPPQQIRGKQNSPSQIATIALYLAALRNQSIDTIAQSTTRTALSIFKIEHLR